MYRIGGALVALVMAVFLAWTVYGSFQTEKLVLPTNGVIDGGPVDRLPASAEAIDVLRQRTALQGWRGDHGPSPEEPERQVITEGDIPLEPAAPTPFALVAAWLDREAEDWNLLRERGYMQGRITLPNESLAVLEQPQGRTWRGLHNEEVVFGGGIVIFGFSLLLALFLAVRGRVPLSEGWSGRRVERFTAFERANHWVTAGSFVVIALTGLLLLYGQYLLKPLIGPSAYGDLALGSAYVHMAFALPLVIGVAIMAVLWIRQNGITRNDLHWLKRFGGMLNDSPNNPQARRFNAGQKLIFWAVVLGTLALLVSGLSLMFPFFWLEIIGMQVAQVVHAAIGLVMVAVIIGHIYIGTVGMEGAFEAMWSGTVDYNWAKEHHELWLEEERPRGS